MAIRNLRDVREAYEAGRWHSQRFFKNAAANNGDGSWIDWSYASGQPAYDARVGVSGEFTPVVATGNDAIWFPAIESGMERRLAGVSFRTSASAGSQVTVEAIMYDLVGYYPLIDGDSTDLQEFDNTLTLPRYTTGAGLKAVLVNHVAPSTAAGGTHNINFTDSTGTSRSGTFGVQQIGVNRSNVRIPGTPAGGSGDLFMALNAPGGVRSIQSIQFTTTPGGLWAIYLVKPLCHFSVRNGSDTQVNPIMSEHCFCTERSFDLPVIPDGAALGMFMLAQGGTRTINSVFGSCRFIWG